MGVAQSNNAAQAIANVSNYVQQSTSANSTQSNEIKNWTNFDGCTVILSGNLNDDQKASLFQTNIQVSKAVQDSNVQNNIQQAMLQQALSTVGTLGVGYADASNTANQFINDSSQILQSMSEVSTQFGTTNNTFDCQDSTIIAKNLNINLDSSNQFLSQQMLNNDQTATIVNNLSQSIQQKASATVEGIGGLIIAILIIIAVIIYAISKPLSSGGAKIAIGVFVFFLLAMIIVTMYLRGTPPFFASPQECINNSNTGQGSDPSVPCVNQQNKQINLSQPPIRYGYQILPSGGGTANLVQMVISAYAGGTNTGAGNNGGYRENVANSIQGDINSVIAPLAVIAGVTNIPNPLTSNVPGQPSSQSFLIPSDYLVTSGPDPVQSVCTPGILQLDYSAAPYEKGSCAPLVNPNNLTPASPSSDPNSVISILNTVDWSNYLSSSPTGNYAFNPSLPNDNQEQRTAFARFALCKLLNQNAQTVDLHLYMQDYELVQFVDSNGETQIGPASSYKNNPNIYRFVPTNPCNLSGKCTSAGTLYGQVGVWNTRQNKFSNFMSKIGAWILLGILILVFCYMGFTWYRNRNNDKQEKN